MRWGGGGASCDHSLHNQIKRIKRIKRIERIKRIKRIERIERIERIRTWSPISIWIKSLGESESPIS